MAPKPEVEFPILQAFRRSISLPSRDEFNRRLEFRLWASKQLFFEISKLTSPQRENHTGPIPKIDLLNIDDEEFFINGILYDEVWIVFGEEQTHWCFKKWDSTSKSLEGDGLLECAFCHCCAKYHFPNVLNAIKTFVRKSSA